MNKIKSNFSWHDVKQEKKDLYKHRQKSLEENGYKDVVFVLVKSFFKHHIKFCL